MLCNNCKVNQATVHLTEIIDEEMTELHLCEDCAREKSATMEQHFGLSDLLAGLADLGAQLGPEMDTTVSCETCGMSYNDFKRIGRLGCSECYRSFEKNLTTLISKEGKVVVNKTAGIVAVTDFRKNIQRIARYLELIEGSVQRQVIIEAQIVEVKLTKEYQAGINWSLVPHNLKLNPVGSELRGALTGGAIVSQTLASSANLFQVGLATRVGAQTIQLILNALSKQGTVAILSSPKISALNNQKAVIKVATDDVFFTTTRTREPVTGLETTTVTPQTITEGIVLDVTPQIAEDNTVIMNIRPSISERVGQATSPDGSIVPIIAVRATDTVVRAQDGQTVIIGGLMQHKSTRSTTGVPGMQDVPVLGGLFRQRVDEGSKTELVILLTPTVVIGRRASELSPTELDLLREAGGARALRR